MSHGTLVLDGHVFDREPTPWADTTIYRHDDCHGADYGLAQVGESWAWWAVVSPEVTLRMDADTPRPLSARDAFDAARSAVLAWTDAEVAAGW